MFHITQIIAMIGTRREHPVTDAFNVPWTARGDTREVMVISNCAESTERPGGGITIDEYFRTVRPDARVRNALRRAGVTTMARLCGMTTLELMRIRNFGVKCLKVVLEEREKYLNLEEETP